MKTIIAGSRNITQLKIVESTIIRSGFNISTVICGGAKGVDLLGEKWAKQHNILIEYYLANWNKFGKKAGYLRNEEMAKNADSLIAIWDGISKGTEHMIKLANKYHLKIYLYCTAIDEYFTIN